MTTYNVATESAEKQAVRAVSKGGASAIDERGVYTLLPPTSGSSTAAVVATITASGNTSGNIPANTYYYYVTGVTNGVESFSNPVATLTTANAVSSVAFTITDNVINPGEHFKATSFKLYVGTSADNATLQATSGTTTLTWTKYTASSATIPTGSIATNGTTWTITTTNNFTVGQSVTISGVTPAAYNGVYTVATVAGSAPAQTGFTITNAAQPGAVTVAGNVSGVLYSNSPAMISYPQASGTGAYSAPNWVGDSLVHNPNATTGYSGFPITGEVSQVRQIRTSIIESQVYSRTDTATVTSGSGTVSDSSITWSDFGKPVTGTGIPTNAFVGNVTYGTSFVLSSVQGQNVPYYPGTTTAFNATANGTSITVSGSNVGPLPVQTGQYRTTRWQG